MKVTAFSTHNWLPIWGSVQLAVNQAQAAQLADVKQWQRELNVRLDLRATQSGLDEYDKVARAGAIRSKS